MFRTTARSITRRGLAILPQPALLSGKDLKREAILRRRVNIAERTYEAYKVVLASPQFHKLGTPVQILRQYKDRRKTLTARDAVAAFYALGRRLRLPPGVKRCPIESDETLLELEADLMAGVPKLRSRDLCNVLVAAGYMQYRGQLLPTVCKQAERKIPQFAYRDLAYSIYALGRLNFREQALLAALITRATSVTKELRAVELSIIAEGLAGLRIAPGALIRNICETADTKIDQFGALELPTLLASFASLDWHDHKLLTSAAEHLPSLLTDMNPRGLCEMSVAFSAARLWLPPTLEALGSEAATKADMFSGAQAVAMLGAFAQLRWDQDEASKALGRQLRMQASRLRLPELAVALRALSRLPLACAPETLSVLITCISESQMPELHQLNETKTLLTLALLCNSLRHLHICPPQSLLRLLQASRIDEKPAPASRVERRAIVQLVDAQAHWAPSLCAIGLAHAGSVEALAGKVTEPPIAEAACSSGQRDGDKAMPF
mmetsp:Transcript_27284/g.45482  ORF Transcript_27284/g.45482 Transcript_27284/m.45482 type:complete len:494 (-) Transcript_27284:19-1500(-)